MNTTYEVSEEVLIVHVAKELDHHIAGKIRERSDKMIEEQEIKGMIFDFSDTTFMDSSGIGMIMGRYRKLIEKGGFVGVAGVNPAINRILEISGLYKIVNLYQAAR